MLRAGRAGGLGPFPAAAAPSAPARPRGGAAGPSAAMSVAFVPERLRGKAEVNQDTLQRVSRTGPGPGPSRAVLRALPARLGQSRPERGGDRGGR